MAQRRVAPRWVRITAWLALLLPVFAWAPLTYPGYFVLHSGFLPIFNLHDLVTAHLTDFAWAPVIGQAHDLWRGERVMAYLLGAPPVLLGLPAVTTVKFVFAASIVSGASGIYFWARRHIGPWPALLAALVYVLWPINLATVYVRGAFAEAIFLGLAPWLLYAAGRATETGRARSAAALALLLAAALWTQAGLALWLSVICLAYMALLGLRRPAGRPARWPALIGWLAGWALGLLGLAPVIARHGWGGPAGGPARILFAEHLLYPHQFLLAGWGVGTSIPGPYDTLIFQIGIVAFGLALFALVDPALAEPRTPRSSERYEQGVGVEALAGLTVEQGNQLKPPLQRRLLIFATVTVLLLVFLSSTLAALLWRILPARTLTYPWQLLLLAGPWLALVAGMGGLALERRLPEAEVADLPLYAGLLALVLLGSYAYLSPETTRAAAPAAPVAIFGEDEIALLDAEVSGSPGPGAALTLESAWQALRPPEQDYTVFFHIVGPDGTLWGQQDSMPQGGAEPTGGWQPGRVVTDTLRLTMRPDAPASEEYRVLLGLYDWQTGERLSAGADDRVELRP